MPANTSLPQNDANADDDDYSDDQDAMNEATPGVSASNTPKGGRPLETR